MEVEESHHPPTDVTALVWEFVDAVLAQGPCLDRDQLLADSPAFRTLQACHERGGAFSVRLRDLEYGDGGKEFANVDELFAGMLAAADRESDHERKGKLTTCLARMNVYIAQEDMRAMVLRIK